MPRIPVHREPKPTPRRSYDGSQAERGQAHGNSNGHAKARRNPKDYELSPAMTHLVAAIGEFVGTFMFLYFAFACQLMLVSQASERAITNGLASSQQNIFTALVYGFSLLVNVWAFYRISGGLFNPAVRFNPNLSA
jgi:aquaporin related protein